MAVVYNLVSCNALLYPDINNVCWKTTHPMEGLYVFIDQVYNGNPIDSTEIYQLTLVGVNAESCYNWIPLLKLAAQQTCTPLYGIFKFKNCETGDYRNFGFPIADPTKPVIRKNGDCDCWEYQSEESIMDEQITAYSEYDDCTECITTRASELCTFGERELSYAVMVSLPPSPPPDRGFAECCYTQLVLADLGDIAPYKNDYNGFYFKRPTPNSTVSFFLIDALLNSYPLNGTTYGTFQDFDGTQPDLSYFIVEWRKVLNLLGAGTYQVKQSLSIAGVTVDYFSNTFTLKPFSINTANLTARIDCKMNGYIVNEDVDFKDSGFKTSCRFTGFFGNKVREFEQDNVVRRDYFEEQVTMSITPKYRLEGHNLPMCITEDILEFFTKGNEIFCSDYNISNHSYFYEVLPVSLVGTDAESYAAFSRKINFTLYFSDRYKNNRKTNG